jgi:TonB family protein
MTAQVRTHSADGKHLYQFTLRCSNDVNLRTGPLTAFRFGVETSDEGSGGTFVNRGLPWPRVPAGAPPPALSFSYRIDSGQTHPGTVVYAADNRGAFRELVWLRIPTTRLRLSGLFPGEDVDVPFNLLSATDRATISDICIPAGTETVIGANGGIPSPTKIKDAAPQYPSTAQGRLQGQVLVEATIGPNGKIISAKVLRGLSPELDAAALKAVQQWEYTPTTFDGVPISVPLTVTVKFSMR